jgi:DNA-binding LytR/AlgR family response regulator
MIDVASLRNLDTLESRRADPGRERPCVLLERLADYRLSPRLLSYVDRIGVYISPKCIRLLEVTAISHFVANHKGTVAMTAEEAGVVRCQLGELEQRLDPRTFVRIHRGAIVNLDWVESIEIGVPGMVISLRGQTRTTLKVARERTGSLKERFVI